MFQKSVWDNLWKYESFQEWDHTSEIILNTLLREIGNPSGRKILEAGSGTGRISMRLAAQGAKVTLLDFSEVAIEQSQEKFEKYGIQAEFIVSDIMNMKEIPDHTFDVVWNAGVLEHFDYEQQLLALGEMKRVLKPDGILITLNPNARSLLYRIGKWYQEKTGEWSFGRELPLYTLQPVCNELGLGISKEYSIGFEDSLYFLSLVPHTKYLHSVISQWYEELDQESKKELDGYLLVSVCHYQEKTLAKNHKEEKDRYNQMREINDSIPTIIILSSVAFREDLWQRPQHLAVHFRNMDYRVIYVNNRFGINRATDANNKTEIVQHSRNMIFSGINDTGIYVFNRLDWLETADKQRYFIREQFFEEVFRFFANKNTKVICYLPEFSHELASLKEKFGFELYYDCVDEMTGFHQSKKVILDEKQLLDLADGLIVTSKTLYVHKSKDNQRCILVPNAVTAESFEDVFEKPNDLNHLEGPIIGYVGAIAHWFDQALMVEIAQKRPDWNFVLVGTILTDVSSMRGIPNLHLLGRREYDQVPAYMKHFDIGIIPFKMDDLIVNTNPIKYYEYLASGIRTVSTPLPELIGEPLCDLAQQADDFISIIEKRLQETDVEVDPAYLQKHSWDNRAKDIISFIENETVLTDRTQIISGFLETYEQYPNSYPLLEVLKAEIYDELGNQEKAKEILLSLKDSEVCWLIQISLYYKWGMYGKAAKILSLLPQNKGRDDVAFWANKSESHLKMHLLRKMGDFAGAEEIAKQLSEDPDVLEEMGNICFEVDRLIDAAKYYTRVYGTNNTMRTAEGMDYYSMLAKILGKNALAKHLQQRYLEMSSNPTVTL